MQNTYSLPLLADGLALVSLIVIATVVLAVVVLWAYAFYRFSLRLRGRLDADANRVAELDRLTGRIHWFIKLAALFYYASLSIILWLSGEG